MKTIVLKRPGRLERAETALPSGPKPGEVVVRVRRVGICGTDLHAFEGHQPFFSYPRVLGHELGVEVVALGPGVKDLAPGDRAAVEPYLNCGNCQACRRNRGNCCAQLQVLGVHVDGGMRELIRVPAVKVHRSSALDLEQLALVETLAIGRHAVQRAGLEAGEAILVVGAGPIGLAILQFARMAGARPLVAEIDEHRLRFCREVFGVEVIDARKEVLTQIEEMLGGEWPTAVFEATGNSRSMATSFRYVAHGGRLILVGFVAEAIAFQDAEFHRREISLLASRNALAEDFRQIIALLEQGQIDIRPWITHRATYADVVERFPGWLDPGQQVIKAMLEW